MARVGVTFDGQSRGAVAAAMATAGAIEKVKLQAGGSSAALGRHSKALADGEKEMGRFTRGTLAGSGALSHLGRSLAFASGGFLAAAGLVSGIKASINAGASLETQMLRTSKVFGAQAGVIKKWSEDSATALRVTRSAALDTANTFGTLLSGMDVAPARIAPMSKALTQLASDLASFSGKDVTVATSALEAAIAGRTRGLKQLGITIDANTVKQEAEHLGLVKNAVDLGKVAIATEQVKIAEYNRGVAISKHGAQSVEAAKATDALANAQASAKTASAGHAEALTNEQKALATYQLLLDKTSKQQGATARTSHTLAGETATLHAQIGDLQEQLGTALIPQLTHYLPLLTGWIDRNEKNGTFQRDFNKIAKTTGDIVGGIVGVVKTAAHVFGLLGDAVGGDKKAFEDLVAAWAGWKLVGKLTALSTVAGEQGAAGSVGLLTSRLKALRILSELGPIVIGIDLLTRDKQVLTGHYNILPKTGIGPLDSVLHYVGLQGDSKGSTRGGAAGALAGTQDRSVGVVWAARQKGPGSGGIYGEQGGGAGARVGGTTYYDCSGYVQSVFAANGFKDFPRTSETQFSTMRGPNWVAQAIDPSQVMPGDLVFYNYNNGYPLPASHVAIVVAGSGLSATTIEYTSSGKPAVYGTVGEGPLAGARRYGLVRQNTSGMSNDPVHDAGANTAATTSTPPKKGGTVAAGAGSFDTTFVEKPKVKKVKLTPLQRAVQAGQKSLAADIAQINDDVAKGLLPDSLGQMLDERARKLQKTLEHVTDPAKIKVLVADFRKTIETALKLPVDAARIAKDIASWQALVKEGLLPKSLQQALERRALELNAKLAKDLTNPAKYKADEQALRQLEEVGRRYADAFAKGVADKSKLAEVARQFREQLNQILGVAPNANIGGLDQLARRLDAITWQLTHPKGLSKAQIGALQTEFGRLSQVYQNGLSQLATQIGDAKTAFEAAWTKLEDQQLQSFDEDTQAHLSAMQKSAQQTLAKLQVMVKGSFGSFMFGGDITQTPTERLIAQMQAQRQQQSDAQAISDAQAQLATDRTSGASASQLAADQKAVDDAVYQQKIDDLQKQADAERAAADKQLADAQQNFTDQETIAENAYQKQRDQQRQALQQQWDDEMKQVEEGKKPLAQALAELGDVAGAAFAGAYLLQLQTVYDSLQKLIDEANALADTTGSGTHIGPIFNPVPRQKKPANISGFATGGWAGHGSRTIDPRDTILARLRPGEYVMSPEEVAAGRPNWARGGGVSVAFPNATFIGAPTREAAEAWAPAIQAAIERHDLGGGMRVHR